MRTSWRPWIPRITTSDGDTYKGTVVGFDPKVDVAVIYVPGLPAERSPPVRLPDRAPRRRWSVIPAAAIRPSRAP